MSTHTEKQILKIKNQQKYLHEKEKHDDFEYRIRTLSDVLCEIEHMEDLV